MTNVSRAEGLDLSNIFETTQAEIDAKLTQTWRHRQPLYELQANSLMLDYAPDFAKLHSWLRPDFNWSKDADSYAFQQKGLVITLSTQTLHNHLFLGWETGIRNEFITLRRNGMTKAGIMEIVMFTQLYAGMRGLGHVYRAVGDFLPVFAETTETQQWPEGWAPDPDAFKCGLDLSTRECTADDRRNIEAWYEKTIGYVPNSIAFGLKHHTEFVKVNRAKWEVAIKTLPKQAAPYMMLAHNLLVGNREGLREAALLGRAWGITDQWLVAGITGMAPYYTGFEGLYTAADALEGIL